VNRDTEYCALPLVPSVEETYQASPSPQGESLKFKLESTAFLSDEEMATMNRAREKVLRERCLKEKVIANIKLTRKSI